jgi:pimeloyl-ACP methyl ester carboxylesterase
VRAVQPDESGFVGGIYWERFGDGEPTVLFVPPWAIVHSRIWKMQVPYFARHFRVVVFDPRGNGRSERPTGAAAYSETEYARDALAVMDASGTGEAVVVSLSLGAQRALLLADAHPERVLGLAFIAPALRLVPDHPMGGRYARLFEQELDTDEGWAKMNAHYWRRDYRTFLEFFFSTAFSEPHSTKQIEDAVGWGLQTDPQAILRGMDAEWTNDRDSVLRLGTQVLCPTLVIQGSQDAVVGPARGAAVADAIPHAQLITLEGCGHAPHLRDPVMTNLLIRDFVSSGGQRSLWRRGQANR